MGGPENGKDAGDSTLCLSAIEREEVYSRLIHEAPLIPGVAKKVSAINDIQWLDPTLIYEGQRFIQRNFFAIICAHLGALLYGFSFRRLSTVLLRTGKSHAVGDSMVRYLSTFIHFKDWYEYSNFPEKKRCKYNDNNNSVFSEIDKTFKDIQKVRAMHSYALKKCLETPLPSNEDFLITPEKLEVISALKKDLQHIPTSPVPPEILTYTPKVTMSQFDLAMTQFGLVGLIFLFPVTLGVRDKEGLRGFFHLWSIFGKLLGIHDKFNIALYPDEELYRRVFTNIGLASLKNMDVRIFTLQKSLLDGFSSFTYFGSVKSFLLFGLSSKEALPEFHGKNFSKLLSWRDWFYYAAFKSILFIYSKSGIVHQFVDGVAKFFVEVQARIYLPKKKR